MIRDVPSPHMYPSPHGSDSVTFVVLVRQMRPAGHGSQLVSSGIPRQGEYVPPGQEVHEMDDDELASR